jgi:hypothetical protein
MPLPIRARCGAALSFLRICAASLRCYTFIHRDGPYRPIGPLIFIVHQHDALNGRKSAAENFCNIPVESFTRLTNAARKQATF